MNLTYELIPGGYRILQDGRPWLDQPFNPSLPGFQPYTPAEAETAAQALIAEIEASVAAEQPAQGV